MIYLPAMRSLCLLLLAGALAAQTTDWTPIASWSGSGTKQTETINVPVRDWRLAWTAAPVDQTFAGDGRFLLTVTVMNADDDTPITVLSSGNRERRGESYVHRTGRFYLRIDGTNATWTVAAERGR